eukprot:scaffold19986_cov56-Attheya_sp.AAC.1
MSHPLTVNGSNGTPGIAGPALFDTFTHKRMTAHMVPHKGGLCDTNGHQQHHFPTMALVSFRFACLIR